ncbi:MAG: hypothetical protein MI743_00440 [Sneathiellales bacterium]|nr:hypothetical protein [Sneathiellales bacterium]
MLKNIFLPLTLVLALGGCATWSHTEATKDGKPLEYTSIDKSAQKDPADVLLSKEDITDKPYETLAELEVIVNKTTIFHADPTPEMVDQKLKEEGAKLGADAVVLIRYGTVGISIASWGSLEGKGRAVKFKKQK